MPARLTCLRIAGFKSFAEPVTVEVRPGLTGVIGPNGCGKSNLIEALRWVMGEGNARALRGGEMDDLIFAGTAARPSRNIAEVTLSLEETAGVAPPPFHEQPEIEVARRIDRGSGSHFRVNGHEVRGRDVQTLFADLASGARGSAMVSQGRVGALVGARPDERRVLLEEAAGITGLAARRHEAELKLRAAEANLERAEELRAGLETQLQGLKRQARQASRFRNLSGAIRAAEAEALGIERAQAAAAATAATAAEAAARATVTEAAAGANSAAAAAVRTGAAVPAARTAEAAAREVREAARATRERIVAEETRARETLAAQARLLGQIRADLAHAERVAADAVAAEERLAAEQAALAEAAEDPALAAAAAAAVTAARAAALEADREAAAATEAAAEAAAAARALAERRSAVAARLARVESEWRRAQNEHQALVAGVVDPAGLAAAHAEAAAAAAALAAARSRVEAAERARPDTARALAEARARAGVAQAERTRLAAEARALADVLAARPAKEGPGVVDAITVPDGLEAAAGAALGEALTAGLEETARRHWRALAPLDPVPALPEDCVALSTLLAGPPALGRALSQVGLLPPQHEARAGALQALLAPGQALVSRAGALWRWDGFCVAAGTPGEAAVRLAQRNRLAGLREALAVADGAEREAREALAVAEGAEREAAAAEVTARAERGRAEAREDAARSAARRLLAEAEAVEARIAALAPTLARLESEQTEAAAAMAAVAAAPVPDPEAARAEMEAARAALAAARRAERAAEAEAERLAREAEVRARRRASIGREREDWQLRREDAEGRRTDLAARAREAESESLRLAALPEDLAQRARAAISALEAAEAAHRAAADGLMAAEREATAAERASRAAEQALAAAREAAIRAEGGSAAAVAALDAVTARIGERLGGAAALPEPESFGAEALEKALRRHERLVREREEMGPVNLRAEAEAEEIAARIGEIERERGEIGHAIAKLRGSIGHLNREGRERLASVFTEIDRHFQALFARMFGGGRAHLALVGSDDPLEAGLEIYAQPPGKKLATLSLLSGGEQALTALSLIFAVFRCNPAPVAVLDEVDAPLDDVNVERFCALLDDMVRETGTRFLVVTHHHLTMARMDRLYGVTMQERGVSRVVSVDLARAVELAQPPRMAAE